MLFGLYIEIFPLKQCPRTAEVSVSVVSPGTICYLSGAFWSPEQNQCGAHGKEGK